MKRARGDDSSSDDPHPASRRRWEPRVAAPLANDLMPIVRPNLKKLFYRYVSIIDGFIGDPCFEQECDNCGELIDIEAGERADETFYKNGAIAVVATLTGMARYPVPPFNREYKPAFGVGKFLGADTFNGIVIEYKRLRYTSYRKLPSTVIAYHRFAPVFRFSGGYYCDHYLIDTLAAFRAHVRPDVLKLLLELGIDPDSATIVKSFLGTPAQESVFRESHLGTMVGERANAYYDAFVKRLNEILQPE